MSGLTVRRLLELPELRALDPRSDEMRDRRFRRGDPDLNQPVARLLPVEIAAAVYTFAPDPEPWTWALEQAAIQAARGAADRG